MEHIKSINKKLGKANVKKIVNAVKHGHIKEAKLQMMAQMMDPEVHGVFVEKLNRMELVDVFRYMLDKFYEVKLYKDKKDHLVDVIALLRCDEVGLPWLANRMKIQIKQPARK